MTSVKKRITAAAGAFACAVLLGTPAAHAAPESEQTLAAGCVQETDRWAVTSGTSGAQYRTIYLTATNYCPAARTVRVDVTLFPDPACETIYPGNSHTFVWSHSLNLPGGGPRGIVYC